MVPKLLIDGYNLLFQSNIVGKSRAKHWLEKARCRLLSLLGERLSGEELATTQIVFDAPRYGAAPEQVILPSGLQVVYAVDHEEADDLLEELIRQHPSPKLLTVVSSDQRIRKTANARRAMLFDSQEFLERLFADNNSTAVVPVDNELNERNAVKLTESEVEYWLRKFNAD